MQQAAAGLAYAVLDYLGTAYGRRVVLLVGPGDNGGDALFAGAMLARRGVLGKSASRKISARLDPGLLDAAREKTGAKSDTELLAAALAIVASDDDFGPWLVTRGPRLPEDFELEF